MAKKKKLSQKRVEKAMRALLERSGPFADFRGFRGRLWREELPNEEEAEVARVFNDIIRNAQKCTVGAGAFGVIRLAREGKRRICHG